MQLAGYCTNAFEHWSSTVSNGSTYHRNPPSTRHIDLFQASFTPILEDWQQHLSDAPNETSAGC